jgi:phosphoglycerate kinase
MKTLKDFDFQNKKVLVRADFNVPLDERSNILDDFRIKKTLPTVEYLIKRKARVILMSHLGRPKGKVVEELRLDPIAERLSELTGQQVLKLNDCEGKEVGEVIAKMQPGDIVLLENIQFNPGENAKDLNFAKNLAGYADIFILEAFGQAHRDYASIAGIQNYLPSAAGFLLEKEIEVLTDLMKNPVRPLLSLVGGKKVETKIGLIDTISEISDWVLISGLIDKELKEKNIGLKYPEKIVEPVDDTNKGEDIGPKTIERFRKKIEQAKTIFWNGPFGLAEKEESSRGTREIADAIIKSGAFSVVGGGETVEFINKIGLSDKFNHVSTGGGAMLDFICDGKLAGVEALKT